MKHRKLSCQQVQEYIDGLSQRQLREKIESSPEYEHIQQCATCQEYFEQAKSLAEKLDKWSVPTRKRSIAAGVMAQIAQLERDRKTKHFSPWSRLPALFVYRLKVPVGAAAAVFIILALSLVLNITGFTTYQESEEKIQVKTDQDISERTKFVHKAKPRIYPGSIQSVRKENVYFFSVSPEVTSTPLVIILGTPGVVPMEPTPQQVSLNSINQSL